MPPELTPISEIVPGLFIGNADCTYNPSTFRDNNITAVVSLVNAPFNLWRRSKFTNFIARDRHLWIESVDSSTQDLLVHMGRICEFIDQMFLPVQHSTLECLSQQDQEANCGARTSLQSPGGVLIHCEQGVSRSATIAIAYLMRKQHKNRDVVLEEIRAKRRVKPSANFMGQLEVWEQVEYQIWEDEERKIPKDTYKEFLEKRAAVLKAKGLTGNEPIRPMNL